MNKILRLFIELPKNIFKHIVILTVIIPIVYWVITGEDLVDKWT